MPYNSFVSKQHGILSIPQIDIDIVPGTANAVQCRLIVLAVTLKLDSDVPNKILKLSTPLTSVRWR